MTERRHSEKVDVSVVVSTWNNCGRLAVTLAALARCVVRPSVRWEVVVVNNNCSDDTDRVVADAPRRLPIVYIREARQGLSRARNAGLGVAKGRLIVFTDDDVEPAPGWIEAYWGAYRVRLEGFYFGGPVESEFEGPVPSRDLLELAPPSVKGLDWGREPRLLNEREFFVGANWACPAAALAAAGGFDPNKGLGAAAEKPRVGEELDLMERLRRPGWQPYYVPGARLTHFVPRSKSSLRHVAARAEANAFERARQNLSGVNGGPLFAGIPRWMYREVVTRWLFWALAKCRGRNAYAEYVSLREMLGIVEAARLVSREAAKGSEVVSSGSSGRSENGAGEATRGRLG